MKRQASFKEYTVTIADSGSAEVYKLFKNALKGLRELCETNKIDYPEYMGAQKLGTKLLKEQNGGDATAVSAIVGQYIISREPNNGIKVSKLYSNTLGSLRELSNLVGFEFDEKWNTRTFGNKVIDAIESGEFKKLAKLKKVEETVEIEMDEDTTAEAAAQEIPADAVLLEPKDPTQIECEEFYEADFKSVIIPDGVTAVFEEAFYGCVSLSSIVVPDSMTSIHNTAFEGCGKLDICWGDGLYQQDGVVYSKDKTSIVFVLNPVDLVLIDSISCIGHMRFSNCTSLQSIVIPDSVTEIDTFAFENCTSLQSIVIPNSVTAIYDETFTGCDNLKSITISKKLKKSIKNMDLPEGCQVIIADQESSEATVTLVPGENAVFTSEDYKTMGCPSDLEIPVGYIAIADNAFEECEDLESVVIPEGVTHIGKYAFFDCCNLESVTLPDSLDTCGDFAFGGSDRAIRRDYEYDGLECDCGVLCNAEHTNILFVCGKPDAYDIDEDITSIGKKFNSCESIETIDFCDSQVEELEDHAFDGCYNMESVYLNDNLKKIGNEVFYNTKITEFVIPNSVTEIGKDAFLSCCELEKITLPEMFKDKLNEFNVDPWDQTTLADEKYEVSFH